MIRPARASDAGGIASIWNPIIRDTTITFNPVEKSEPEIAALMNTRQAEGHAFLVAETGGKVLGFASYSQFRPGPGYARCMEHSLYLAPQARGEGLGRALMDALAKHARARPMRMLIGAMTESNTNSVAFHARLGFVEVAHIPDAGWKFGRYHDLVLMQLRL